MFRTNHAPPCKGAVAAVVLATLIVGSAAPTVHAADEVGTLSRQVEELRRNDEENRARIAELERLLHQVLESPANARPGRDAPATVDAKTSKALDRALGETAAQPAPAASTAAEDLDRALRASGPSQPTVTATAGAKGGDLWSAPIAGGAAQARLIDTSLLTLVAAGGSSVGNDIVGELQGGAHDPNQNGFTLQQMELSFTGAIDPYFSGEAHIVGTTEGFELEEAFFTTSSLPYGFQVEAGHFFSEFGLINPLHPHAWDWLDQPIVNTRLFGGDGLRGPGVRIGWLLPTPFFSELHVGLQNANEGEFTGSFIGEEGVGGRPNRNRDVRGLDDLLWLVRSNSSWDLNPETTLLLGASALYGPNATGPDGRTWIYGIDAKVRWRPQTNFRGWPFVLWQTEAIRRDYKADGFIAGTDVDPFSGEFPNDLPGDTLHDQGFYTQLLYGFRYGWAAGARAEYATGSGLSVADGLLDSRANDPLRDARLRLSPILIWHPTEFSRFRIQYNYDNADHLTGSDAHTFWLGAEVMYGKHAAHKY